MDIEWELSEAQSEHFFDRSRYLVVEGSAGSGKTIFACHKVVLYALEHKNARIGVFRLTLPALKITAWLEIRNVLIKYNIPYEENKSEGVITLTNGSSILFKSLDDLRKIRSMNLDYIYCEQMEEVRDFKVFQELDARIRSEVMQKDYGQFMMVVTPETQGHWIYENFHRNPMPDSKVIHFHYTSNPFVDEDYIRRAEELKNRDYDSYIKLTLGKWGKVGNIVYENWDIRESPRGYEYFVAGMDFGYNNPSCFLLIGWYDGEPYVIDEVYESGLLNSQFITKSIKMLQKHGLNPSKLQVVYGDGAEPDRMEEFRTYGFNVANGVKDVIAKTQATKSVKIHIAPRCEHTISEIQDYYFQQDKDGNILDKPVKFNDHAMDSLGYAVYGSIGQLSANKTEIVYEGVYGR